MYKETKTSRSSQSIGYSNAIALEQEMAWCDTLIRARLTAFFALYDTSEQAVHRQDMASIDLPQAPSFSDWALYGQNAENQNSYGVFVNASELTLIPRLALALAMASLLRPALYEPLLIRNEASGQGYFEFGIQMDQGRPYASGETLAFLLSGGKLDWRFQVQTFLATLSSMPTNFDVESKLIGLLELDENQLEKEMQRGIKVTDVAALRFTTGAKFQPEANADFPARYISSELDWSQLVLPDTVMNEVEMIQDYLTYGEDLINQFGLKGKIRAGYRALFYGPPGTGKTLTASLLGKVTGRDVYRIDISLLVSKYIGETEKNLEKVFAMAQSKQWILFFDEADALFGKRNQVNSANDQFANQNVAYLLQRIETFPGVVILASNLKDNLDNAFYRRFESMVYFPLPDKSERLILWRNGFSGGCLEDKVDLSYLANKYVLSGSNIMNVIRYAAMQSIRRRQQILTLRPVTHAANFDIYLEDIEKAIAKELEAQASSPVLFKNEEASLFY
jgi:AAA+ superfamily predicted ATPase